VFLPFFNGERTPNLPYGRASVNGITQANFKRENLVRAALESAIFGMKIGLDRFAELGFSAKEIHIAGGGAKSKIWQGIAANVTGLPVKAPLTSEAAAMGGALQALWCAKLEAGGAASTAQAGNLLERIVDDHISFNEDATVTPDAESVKQYAEAYKAYERYLGALSPLYK
jgi:xylulokinase